MFESILSGTENLTITNALICMGTSIVLGLVIAFVHMYTSKCSKNFAITLSTLPVMVQVIIMMVNGNLGTSVAILGVFGLVRFRSMQGNSREIASIFFAMGIGLAVRNGTYFICSRNYNNCCNAIYCIIKNKIWRRKYSREKIKNNYTRRFRLWKCI